MASRSRNKSAKSIYGISGIISSASAPCLPKEEIISAKKSESRVEKEIRQKVKNDSCWLCEKQCTSFCNSHSIPRYILENIAEHGCVSALNQVDAWEPDKKTGISAAGVFENICNDCDSKFFQIYENEEAWTTIPTDEILTKIATKNYLKWIYRSMIDIEKEKVFSTYSPNAQLIQRGDISPANHDLREMYQELCYALHASTKPRKYYLQYYKRLDYTVPYAAQYLLGMLVDLNGNLIHDIYNSSQDYRVEYIHVAIFPLKQSSVIILFTREGKIRHRRFIRQLKKLTEQDQLSAINYLTLSSTENVYFNPTVYAKMSKNPIFLAACRMTYSIQSTISNPSSLEIARHAYNFEKRYALPNLLSQEYAIKQNPQL